MHKQKCKVLVFCGMSNLFLVYDCVKFVNLISKRRFANQKKSTLMKKKNKFFFGIITKLRPIVVQSRINHFFYRKRKCTDLLQTTFQCTYGISNAQIKLRAVVHSRIDHITYTTKNAQIYYKLFQNTHMNYQNHRTVTN